MTVPNDLAVRRALEAAGVEFINENGGGAGLRLRKRQEGKAFPVRLLLVQHSRHRGNGERGQDTKTEIQMSILTREHSLKCKRSRKFIHSLY